MPRIRPFRAVVACVVVACLAGATAHAAEPAWRVEKGDVRVTVPLKPGGAFEATSASLAGTLTPAGSRPVRLSGELTLDLATIDTGIVLRNQHLREKYLQVSRGRGFDHAVLTDLAVNDAAGADFQGRSAFSGSLLLHGVAGRVTGTAEIRRSGAGVKVDATFPLALPDYGIEPPEYLGVGVGNKVIVRVQLSAAPRGALP